MALSDVQLRALKPAEKPFKISDFADGRRVHLSKAEAKVLAVRLSHAGQEVSRARLILECSEGAPLSEGAINLRIRRLRRPLGASGESIIESCRGQGYRVPVSVLICDDEVGDALAPGWPRAA